MKINYFFLKRKLNLKLKLDNNLSLIKFKKYLTKLKSKIF